MIHHFKFKAYVAFNFVSGNDGQKGIKIEIYQSNLRIDYFDYVSSNTKESVKRLRDTLNKGISCDSLDRYKGVDYLKIKTVRYISNFGTFKSESILNVFISGVQ